MCLDTIFNYFIGNLTYKTCEICGQLMDGTERRSDLRHHPRCYNREKNKLLK